MSIYVRIERLFETLTVFFWKLFIWIHELKNIWSKRALVMSFKPTAKQAEDARRYWKKLTGRRWPLWWHRLYASYTGKWDPKYIPEMLFSVNLEPNSSRRCDRDALADKNNLVLFAQGGGLRIPNVYASCTCGLVNRNGVLLNMNETVNALSNIGPCVIKRTRDSDSGRDVAIVDFKDGRDIESGKSVKSIVESMGGEWVCQERVHQHESIDKIYPESVNTLRIVTYMTDQGVGACPVTLRIGQGGAKVDNAHAGGIFIYVDNDGYLGDEAFTEYQKRFIKHPDTEIPFKGRWIAGVPEAIEAVKRCHFAVSELGFISWDVCVDEEGMPTLLEVNLVSQAVWMSQMASGLSMFGDDTPSVVKAYRRNAV